MNYNESNVTPPPFYGAHEVSAQVTAVMKRVYVRMFIALLISAFCALGVASSPALINTIFFTPFVKWGILIAMFAMAWVLPTRMQRMSTGSVLLCFMVFAALMGIWITPIFLVYNIGSIVYTFFITAGMFGAMSVYGFCTKTDLSRVGSYLVMALIGIIIASIVNIFLKSSSLEWIISIAGVLIFTGLTAWDTQAVKRMAAYNVDPASTDKLATMGALNLYLDFINLFLFLLRFLGGSRD